MMEASVICSVIANDYLGKMSLVRETLTSDEIYYLYWKE